MTGQPLDDAVAKLGRATAHVQVLRADIRDAGQGEPYTIPLRVDVDGDTGTLHIRVDRETARPERWGLMIGDALHNLRSALDNAWWQLARRNLQREPTKQEAKQIQFPIVKPGGRWDHGTATKWVGADAAQFAREIQPDPQGYPPDVSHPLEDLRRLSNTDKHRHIHTTVQMLHELALKTKPEGTPAADMEGISFTVHHFGGRPPQAGDDVLSTPPGFTSSYRKVRFEAHQTGFVAIEGGRQSVLTVLDGVADFVEGTLAGFSHVFAGKQPPKAEPTLGPRRI